MSAAPAIPWPERLYRARRWLYLSVLGVSIVCLGGVWLLVSSGSRGIAGAVAGVMLAVWLATGLASLVMRPSRADQPEVEARSVSERLNRVRGRVMRAGLITYLTVLGLSIVGLAGVWLLESSGSREIAGGVAGVLVAVWLATGLATLVVVVLMVMAAMVSTSLKVLGLAGVTGEKGDGGDV